MAAEAMDPFPDYSKTQRIVLLIDLNPLLHLHDPNPFLRTLLSSSKTLLSFPPLSSSLFSFKPFFSSLSPLLSSSKLPFPSLSLSFNHPDSTLQSLTHFLTSLPATVNKASFPLNPSRALNLNASLRQLVHEYAWDPLISDPAAAMLCLIDDGFCLTKLQEQGRVDLAAYVPKGDVVTSKPDVNSKHSSRFLDSQRLSPSDKCAEKRRKNKKNFHLLHDLTWSAFCQAALERLEIDLAEGYFARDCNNSKKLKFLKCWMKQVKKYSTCSLEIRESAKPDQDTAEEINHRPIELPQDSEQPVSCSASAGELDEATNDFCSGTLENFLNTLPNKIERGLVSGEVELGAFAERLVSSSIYWLCQKHEIEDNSESQTSLVKANDACSCKAAVELTELLLREPKDLAAMHKKKDPSSLASDSRSIGSASIGVVREYELQILFRMEILQSKVGAIIDEPMKLKFVKQICSLLESIQCHLEGGFFGDWRLDKYVEKIIKSRYHHSLGDVVDRIYAKMDLLLFDDEDELPNHLLNSEDSSRSWKEKPEKDVNYRSNELDSIEDDSPQLQKNNTRSPQVIRSEEHARKLIEAQERRERARRFSSFTSWMPDLQRVWAPKQLKATKPKSDPLRKLSKRKHRSQATYDMVCETPMTDKKRLSPHGDSSDDEEDHEDSGARSHGPVSKALFQDHMQ